MSLAKEVIREPFWTKTPKEVVQILDTNIEKGLNDEEILKRQKLFGINTLADGIQRSTIGIFLRQFKSPLIFILVIAAVLTLVLQKWGDFAVITMAVLVNAALGFYQEHKAESALEHLKTYLQERVRVIREGKEFEIDVKELVPGDVVHLMLGNRIPADGRVIEANGVMIDEAILTGESLPVEKHSDTLNPATLVPERSNMLFGGTLMVQGNCRMIVCATGNDTEFGKIATLVKEARESETPLQKSIKKFAWIITAVLAVFIIGIFIQGVVRGETVLDMFFIAVAMAVGAVPEGLPIALTVVFAVGVERLAKRNGVVRRLVAAETLGSTTVILTDKTGTLTRARMSISRVLSPKQLFSRTLPKEHLLKHLSPDQKEILTVALLSTEVLVEEPDKESDAPEFVGRSLEMSLAKEAFSHGLSLGDLRKNNEVDCLLPFSSSHKFAVYRLFKKSADTSFLPWGQRGSFAIFFGAPEVLLSMAVLKKDEYMVALEHINTMALDGERVLGVGYKKIQNTRSLEKKFSGITFGGIISFSDPVREEVPEVMRRVESFGVRTVIVTGDHRGTAMAVAKSLGWNVNDAHVLDGAQLATLSDEALTAQLNNIRIFARVTPEDKLRIVKLFRASGESVAMTGDGVNDAPSLKEADVGIAVGSGTDVAKDVADLVLLDNNFKTIVVAIEEGKKIVANIKKTIVYLLSSILDEVLLIGGSVFLGWPLPLTALQILWVNFFSDSFPAISFAFENDSQGIYRKTNRIRNQIFDKEVKTLLVGVGVVTSVLLFGLYALFRQFSVDQALVRTFIFASFGLYSLFVVFPLKSLRASIFSYNIFSNPYMVAGVFLGVAMMASAIYLPFLQSILGTVALPFPWMLGVMAIVLLNVAIAEGVKWFFRRT